MFGFPLGLETGCGRHPVEPVFKLGFIAKSIQIAKDVEKSFLNQIFRLVPAAGQPPREDQVPAGAAWRQRGERVARMIHEAGALAVQQILHAGRYGGGRAGLSLVLPHGVLDFLEILQFGRGRYDIWYQILNSGFRLTPTAGTDYPWGWSFPGRERFYTRVRGRFSADKWIEAVRAGETFVTNGPMLVFRINGKRMGETVELPAPGTVSIEAQVLFDPRRDLVSEIEIVENGTGAVLSNRGSASIQSAKSRASRRWRSTSTSSRRPTPWPPSRRSRRRWRSCVRSSRRGPS